MRILVVEDDPKLAATVAAGLREEGYRVDQAADGAEAELLVAGRSYDVIVLDRLLPVRSGDDLLRQWRQQGVTTPVLMLTALDAVADRVAGLRRGADDYLTKPFAFAELLARIETLARRAALPLAELQVGLLHLDPATRTLRCGPRSVSLSAREYALLELFFRHPGQIMTRERIATAGWDEPWEASDNLIEAHIKNLRRKIAMVAPEGQPLRTVRGAGYRLEADNGEPGPDREAGA